MDDNKNFIEKIKELLERLREAIKKRAMEKQNGKITPAIFEKQLKEVERKLEEFDEQDAIHSDCLRDVAETLEKITGVIENGELRNATIESINANFNAVQNKLDRIQEKGTEPYVVTAETLEEVLNKAFRKTANDFYITTPEGDKVLSPDVNFVIDKQSGKAADVYMVINNLNTAPTAMKIDVNKDVESGIEKISFEQVHNISRHIDKQGNERFHLSTSANECETLEKVSLDNLRQEPLAKVIGEALFQGSKEYQTARLQKGYHMADEWKNITGTKDSPYTKDEFQCYTDKTLGYCIKDRINNSMIALKFDDTEKSYTATYFSNVTKGFEVNPEEGEQVLKVQKIVQDNGKANLSYSISTSPNADKILDTEMAQKAFSMTIPNRANLDTINAARGSELSRTNEPQPSFGGSLVQDANRDKIIMLRNEIEKQLRSKKGLDSYFVAFRSTRHGKESQIVISAPDKIGKSEYTINFDKQGNIKSHLWSSFDIATGKRNKPTPVVRTSKNFINKVLDKEALSKNELCVCYQIVRDSLKAVDDKLQEQGLTFSQNMEADRTSDKAIFENALIEQWADLAKDAIVANGLRGRINDEHELVNLILNQAEVRDGVYPNAEFKAALVDNIDNVYYALSEKNVIDDAFSKRIASKYAGREEVVQIFEAVGYASNEARDAMAQQFADSADTFMPDEVYGTTTSMNEPIAPPYEEPFIPSPEDYENTLSVYESYHPSEEEIAESRHFEDKPVVISSEPSQKSELQRAKPKQTGLDEH